MYSTSYGHVWDLSDVETRGQHDLRIYETHMLLVATIVYTLKYLKGECCSHDRFHKVLVRRKIFYDIGP
jgi:hypothetical protein